MLAVIRISEITFESGVAGISGVTGNSGRWPPDLQGGLFYIFLHYPFKAHMRKKESMLQGTTFPSLERWLRSSRKGCSIIQGTYETN